jgi:non-ribosomal peptide synthetase component F
MLVLPTRHASRCDKLKAYLFGGEPLPPELVGVVQNAASLAGCLLQVAADGCHHLQPAKP